jgi:hypothetical protein
VGAEQAGDAHPTLLDVILRDVAPGDDVALASFDPGSGTSWLDEVAEIVGGVIPWRDDPAEHAFERRVEVRRTVARSSQWPPTNGSSTKALGCSQRIGT